MYLATPLNVISSMITGSDRPLALAANIIILYEFPGSKLSMKNDTGGFCQTKTKRKKELLVNFLFVLNFEI